MIPKGGLILQGQIQLFFRNFSFLDSSTLSQSSDPIAGGGRTVVFFCNFAANPNLLNEFHCRNKVVPQRQPGFFIQFVDHILMVVLRGCSSFAPRGLDRSFYTGGNVSILWVDLASTDSVPRSH